MKLTYLDPMWILNEGGRRWFIFKSPGPGDDWLTCRNFKMPKQEELTALWAFQDREDLDLRGAIVSCKSDQAWKIEGESFADLTVTPSIDASASGNWHGHIRNGEIV